MINWDEPLEAVSTRGGPSLPVKINHAYTFKRQGIPVAFPKNVWSDWPEGGTWYVNEDGLVIVGITPNGYEGQYIVRNR